MSLTGTHAYISILIKNKLSYGKWFFVSFLFGSIIPDIDYFFSKLHLLFNIPYFLSLLNKTFFHSIITVTLVYLILLILYEIKKNKKHLHMANGILLGMSLHILLDIFLWYDKIDVFWPLPVENVHIWSSITLSKNLSILILSLEFLFFRIFAWHTITSILNHPGENKHLISPLTTWMKTQLYIIIIFIISSYFLSIYYIYIIFFIGYIPSLFMMIYIVYYTWDSLDYYEEKNTGATDKNYNERSNLININ